MAQEGMIARLIILDIRLGQLGPAAEDWMRSSETIVWHQCGSIDHLAFEPLAVSPDPISNLRETIETKF